MAKIAREHGDVHDYRSPAGATSIVDAWLGNAGTARNYATRPHRRVCPWSASEKAVSDLLNRITINPEQCGGRLASVACEFE